VIKHNKTQSNTVYGHLKVRNVEQLTIPIQITDYWCIEHLDRVLINNHINFKDFLDYQNFFIGISKKKKIF